MRSTPHSRRPSLIGLQLKLKAIRAQNTSYSKILSKLFSPSQIKILSGRKMIHWDVQDIVRSHTLKLFGNKAYTLIKDKWNIPLPSQSTLGRWGRKMEFYEGTLHKILQLMKGSGQVMDEHERVCVLLMR